LIRVPSRKCALLGAFDRRFDFPGHRVPDVNRSRSVEVLRCQEFLDPLPQRLSRAHRKFVPAVRVPPAVPNFAASPTRMPSQPPGPGLLEGVVLILVARLAGELSAMIVGRNWASVTIYFGATLRAAGGVPNALYGNNVRAREEVAMDTMTSIRDQRKKEMEKAMEEGRKKHLKMLRDIMQELTGKSLSLSDKELSDRRFPPKRNDGA
jgi:hypothetical protein